MKKKMNISAYSYKCFMRDESHQCQLGKTIKIKNKLYMVIVTYNKGVILLTEQLKTKKVSWKTWDNFQIEDTNKIFIWNNEIKQIIEKELNNLKKIYQKKKIKRTPILKKSLVIKRTPITQ